MLYPQSRAWTVDGPDERGAFIVQVSTTVAPDAVLVVREINVRADSSGLLSIWAPCIWRHGTRISVVAMPPAWWESIREAVRNDFAARTGRDDVHLGTFTTRYLS